MMRMRASLPVLLAVSFTVPAHAADPTAQTNALIAAFKAVKIKPAEPLSDADRKVNSAAFLALDAFFDYDRITAEAIAPHKAAFSGEALKAFQTDFREIIRLVAYPDSGSALTKAKIKLSAGAKRPDKKQADVNASIRFEGEDSDTQVTFHWVDVSGAWKVYDVSFDGSSLMKDYQNQFGRIIDREKVDGLMKKLRKKLEEKRRDGILAP